MLPENWIAVQIMIRTKTQWNVGMGGPVGLQYLVVNMLLDLMNIDQQDRLDVLDDIRAMEVEALQEIYDQQKSRGKK